MNRMMCIKLVGCNTDMIRVKHCNMQACQKDYAGLNLRIYNRKDHI